MTIPTRSLAALLPLACATALTAQANPQVVLRAMVLAQVHAAELRLDEPLLQALVADPGLPSLVRDNTEGGVARVVAIEAQLTSTATGDTVPIAVAITVEPTATFGDAAKDLALAALIGHLEQSFDTLFYGPPRARLRQRVGELEQQLGAALQVVAEHRVRSDGAEADLAAATGQWTRNAELLAETRLGVECERRTLQHLRESHTVLLRRRAELLAERGGVDGVLAGVEINLASLGAVPPATTDHESDEVRKRRARAAELAAELQDARRRREAIDEQLAFSLGELTRVAEHVLATSVELQRAESRLEPLLAEHARAEQRLAEARSACLAARANVATERAQIEIAALRTLLTELHARIARLQKPRCHLLRM